MRARLCVTSYFLLLAQSVYADPPFADRLAAAAAARTAHAVTYDGGYRRIAYPMGDVPATIGVCTDVVIRSYRALGVDLQRLVHEDLVRDFGAYPTERIWGQTRPDTNIDHRSVPNLRVFFARNGTSLEPRRNPGAFRPGDIVTWTLPQGVPHIGIVSVERAAGSDRPMVVHNIGAGPRIEDVLFTYRMTGHYRFEPSR